MTTTKIQNTHQERMAYVYVRQSTPIQVMENRESTERQYRLRDRAIELGWAPVGWKSSTKIKAAQGAYRPTAQDSSDWSLQWDWVE